MQDAGSSLNALTAPHTQGCHTMRRGDIPFGVCFLSNDFHAPATSDSITQNFFDPHPLVNAISTLPNTQNTALCNTGNIANNHHLDPSGMSFSQGRASLIYHDASVSSTANTTGRSIDWQVFVSLSANKTCVMTPVGYLHAPSAHFSGRPTPRVVNIGEVTATAPRWHWDSGRMCLLLPTGIG